MIFNVNKQKTERASYITCLIWKNENNLLPLYLDSVVDLCRALCQNRSVERLYRLLKTYTIFEFIKYFFLSRLQFLNYCLYLQQITPEMKDIDGNGAHQEVPSAWELYFLHM
jgi:hypothetical protein